MIFYLQRFLQSLHDFGRHRSAPTGRYWHMADRDLHKIARDEFYLISVLIS